MFSTLVSFLNNILLKKHRTLADYSQQGTACIHEGAGFRWDRVNHDNYLYKLVNITVFTIIVFTYFINPQITPSFLRLIATFCLEGSHRAKLLFHHFWKTTYFRYGIDCFPDKLLNEPILPIFCLGSLLQAAVHQLRYGHCWLPTALQLK